MLDALPHLPVIVTLQMVLNPPPIAPLHLYDASLQVGSGCSVVVYVARPEHDVHCHSTPSVSIATVATCPISHTAVRFCIRNLCDIQQPAGTGHSSTSTSCSQGTVLQCPISADSRAIACPINFVWLHLFFFFFFFWLDLTQSCSLITTHQVDVWPPADTRERHYFLCV